MTQFFSKPRIDLSVLQPTSKLSLKLTCLAACNNDVKTATELYDFIAGDMALPDIDPERPTTFGMIKQGAEDIFGWVQEHKDELMQGYQLIRGMRGGATAATPPAAPPIPDI